MFYSNQHITIETSGLIRFNAFTPAGTIVLRFTKPTDEDTWCVMKTLDDCHAGSELTETDIFPNTADIFRHLPEALRRNLMEENLNNPGATPTPVVKSHSRVFDRQSFGGKRFKGKK